MRRVFVVFLSICIALALAGCVEKQLPAPISETRVLLDTYCTITIYGKHETSLLDEAFDLCAEYEEMLGINVAGSDVWRINHAVGEAVAVAPQTVEVIMAGLGYGELSEGFFDITVGRLSTLWGFSGETSVPSEAEIEAALLSVGYRQVSVEGDTVRLSNPDIWLDLGGIAKGYIADQVALFLKERGVAGAVIDLGGDVAVVGGKPDGSPWLVGVRQPFGEHGDLLGVIETGEASVVTSGVYERQFVENGVTYHHILDPFTGRPARSDVTGATVVAEGAAAGDALSTIAVLLGSDRAAGVFANAPGFVGALLVLDSGELLQFGDIDFR